MITKSKFIKGLWFIEVAIEANTFYIDNLEDTLGEFITSTLDCKGPALIIQREEDRNCISYYSPDTFYCLQKNNIKNPKGLFLTKLATEEDWKELRPDIKVVFNTDNYFWDLKESEILSERLKMVQFVDAYVGKYFSSDYVRRNILKQTEEEMKKMDGEMEVDRQRIQQEQLALQAQQQAAEDQQQGTRQ